MIAFFNRRQVKTLARQHLQEHGWLRAVLAAFVSAVLIQLFTELRSTLKMVSRIQDGASWLLSRIELPTEWASLSAGTLAVIEAVVSVLSVMILLYTLFLGGIFQLGRSAWFLRFCRGEKPPLTGIFGAFRYYGRAFFTHFLITLYTSLWSLLFFIPGIVKGYSYSLAPYLLYDNPNLTASGAIALSQKLTAGHKGELFMLDLSFLGWRLLDLCTLGITGYLFSKPYYHIAYAEAYRALKHIALANGRISRKELGDYTI